MFSLREPSSASSSGIDEDSFGWWIGVESHSQPADEPCTASIVSSDRSPSSCVESSEDCPLRAGDLTQRVAEVESAATERIELDSLDGAEAGLDSGFGGSEGRAALCYTPERLVKSEDFRILAPSPRLYPTLADLSTIRSTPESFRSLASRDDGRLGDGKIAAEHLAALLQSSYYESSSSSCSSCRRCCCIRYGGGEVLLHTERCPRNDEEKDASVQWREPIDSEYDEEMYPSKSRTYYSYDRDRRQPDLADDTSGVSSVDRVSCGVPEEVQVKTPRRLSDELAYVSFEYALAARESQADKTSDINEVVSILAGLDNDPRRAEELLLDEDRFREATLSSHDSIARLALNIEPDAIPVIPAVRVNGRDDEGGGDARFGRCQAEIELEQLRDRLERLQGSSKDLYQEINSLRRDFVIDEWKVNNLSEGVSKLRTEVYELRYLDDLLKLLKGELERISNRNWPFAIGRTKHGTEEVNLVV